MKIYIISYVPAQIPCLGKFLFLRYGPKCSQQIRFQYFLISDFLHVDSNSHKVWWKHSWVVMVRNECSQSGHGILNLVVSQARIDEMNWFFACWWKFRKANSYFNDFWVDMVKNRHGHLIHEILKSAEWFYELSSFFACCWKFRKANSYFNDFWVDMVKNRHGHLIHEILKSAEWFYELSSFFACWLWCNNFWLDQHHTPYLWLLNVSLLQLYLLDPWQ